MHATAQAVWDVRRLLSWIRSQEPDSPIGLNSMSLGGYISSLVASLEDGLSCAILGVPVIDLIQVFGYHAGFAADDPRRHMLDLAKPLGRMLSPLSLTPRVPMQGRFVYSGIADQVVIPREQPSASGSTGADPRSSGTTADTGPSSGPGRCTSSSTTRLFSPGWSIGPQSKLERRAQTTKRPTFEESLS